MALIAQSKLIEDSRFSEPARPEVAQHGRLLAKLAEIGCPRELIAALLEMGGTVLSTDARRFLTGPLVVDNSGGWHELMPRWMAAQAVAERVEIVLGLVPWPVGPTETAAVMYAAAMAAPRSSEFVDLYSWATSNAVARHTGKGIQELWLKIDRIIPDHEVISPAGRLNDFYRQLAGEVRRNVIRAAERQEALHRSTWKVRQAAEPRRPVVEDQQFSLFDK